MERPICTRCNKRPGEPNKFRDKNGVDRSYYKKKCHDCRRRPYLAYKKDSCEFCGFIAVNTCQLDVDHIDGNHSNNEPENLQTLCANCHRLKTFLNKEGLYYDRGAK